MIQKNNPQKKNGQPNKSNNPTEYFFYQGKGKNHTIQVKGYSKKMKRERLKEKD
jgi:hypothetical protein